MARVESPDQDVAAIVVNWNNAEPSVECLRSLVATGYPRLMLVLVDNNSDRDPSAMVSAAVPNASVLRLETNRGYAAACNAGAKLAISKGAQYLFFLNNDAVIDARCIHELVLAAKRHPGCILGPKLVFADQPGVIWAAGGTIDPSTMVNRHIGEGDSAGLHVDEHGVDWLCGCALFVDISTYIRVGPMDEDYFLYLEDVDWSLMAQSAGVERWFVPQAVVKHAISATSKGLPTTEVLYYGCRNTLRLALRQTAWPGRMLVRGNVAWMAAKVVVRNAIFESRRRDRYYQARTQAVLDALWGRWGKAPESVRREPLASTRSIGGAA